jgi:hypothetical protein
MPQDQRSDDPPHVAESASQFGFWEMDLGEMTLTLSDTTCTIYVEDVTNRCGASAKPSLMRGC